MLNSSSVYFLFGLAFLLLGMTALIVGVTNKTKYSFLTKFTYLGLWAVSLAVAQWQHLFYPLMFRHLSPEVFAINLGHRLLMAASAFYMLTFGVALLASINIKFRQLYKLVIAGFVIYFFHTFIYPAESLFQDTVAWSVSIELFTSRFVLLPGGLIASGALIYFSLKYKSYRPLSICLLFFSGLLATHVILTAIFIYDATPFSEFYYFYHGLNLEYIISFIALILLLLLVKIRYFLLKEDRKQGQSLHDEMLLSGERDRVAYDLHDGTIQSLYAASLRLGKIVYEIEGKQQEEIKRDIMHVKDTIAASIVDLRGYIYDNGLQNDKYLNTEKCIHEILNELQATTDLDITFEYVNTENILLNPNASENICLIVKEAVTNIIKHAQGTKAEINFAIYKDVILLTIKDDGIGFRDKEENANGTGIGMQSIKERVARLDGALKVVVDKGITLEINIPNGGLAE